MIDAPLPGIAESAPWWVGLVALGITAILAPVILQVVKAVWPSRETDEPKHGRHRESRSEPAGDTELGKAMETLLGYNIRRLSELEQRATADMGIIASLRRENERLQRDLADTQRSNIDLARQIKALQTRIAAIDAGTEEGATP